jgi:hypothetical protein
MFYFCHAECLNPTDSEGEMTIGPGHPELVERSRAEALPTCFDRLSMTPILIMSWVGTKHLLRPVKSLCLVQKMLHYVQHDKNKRESTSPLDTLNLSAPSLDLS